MKKSKNLLIALTVIVALVVGFLIGISVNYPRLNSGDVSGTIGKVNNYRNTKATEADIQLKDELLADTVMLRSVRNYMNFNYVRAVELGKNIDFAVAETNANEAFKVKCKSEIASLESYGKYLKSARKDLLLAVAVCQSADKAEPVLLRNTLAQANNVIAQMNYRNRSVLSFIGELDAFIQESGVDKNKSLNKAHDLLTYNEIGSSMVLNDKALLKFFENKKLYSTDLKSETGIGLKDNIQQDMEQLKFRDSELLGFKDSEQLGAAAFNDIEKLGMIVPFDAEKLGIVMDAEKLGYVVPDTEQLGQSLSHDSEQLGVCNWDSEKLNIVFDSEILGGW